MLFILMQLLEAEITRFSHLCDRASDMGHRKEYPLLLKSYQQLFLFYSVLLFACHYHFMSCFTISTYDGRRGCSLTSGASCWMLQ